MEKTTAIDRVRYLMQRLRDPETGCPWDLEQDFKSIASCTIEEAYEVVDAIDRDDRQHLKEELGDLLLQVVFHSQMADEEGSFNFDDVADTLVDKLVRRHPHVFPNGNLYETFEKSDLDANAVKHNWDAIKREEKARANPDAQNSVLDGVSAGVPPMTRAMKLQKKAAKVGFDWPTLKPVFDKVKEELFELEQVLEAGSQEPGGEQGHKNGQIHQQQFEEFGDILFCCANLARHLKLDPDAALRSANRKFERRFHWIEHQLRENNLAFEEVTLEQMDAWWDEAKKKEIDGELT